MAIPNYTDIKLKISGPRGVIMTSASFKVVYAFEWASSELIPMLARS
jgi:hypothetical protein